MAGEAEPREIGAAGWRVVNERYIALPGAEPFLYQRHGLRAFSAENMTTRHLGTIRYVRTIATVKMVKDIAFGAESLGDRNVINPLINGEKFYS